jgi:hypothetical protein
LPVEHLGEALVLEEDSPEDQVHGDTITQQDSTAESNIGSLYGNTDASTSVESFAQRFFGKATGTIETSETTSPDMQQMLSFIESSD